MQRSEIELNEIILTVLDSERKMERKKKTYQIYCIQQFNKFMEQKASITWNQQIEPVYGLHVLLVFLTSSSQPCLILFTGNKHPAFPTPDLSKLKQQGEKMLYLLQVPCT